MGKIVRIEGNPVVERGELTVDPLRHIVKFAGKEIILYPKEFDLLYLLVQYPGWVLTAEQIYEAVWQEDSCHCSQEVYYTVCQLRKKLKRPELIQTVRKYGYKFVG